MAIVFANALWFLEDGITTSDSLTAIAKGVDTSVITDGDLTAAGVELLACEGVSPSLSINKEDVYAPVRSGTPLSGTASYGLAASPTLDFKNELVATFSEVTTRITQLFFGTQTLVNGTPQQVQGGAPQIEGLVLLNQYDSNSAGAERIRAWFWTEMTLTSMNADRAVSKPQLTLNLIANGTNSPVLTTGLS